MVDIFVSVEGDLLFYQSRPGRSSGRLNFCVVDGVGDGGVHEFGFVFGVVFDEFSVAVPVFLFNAVFDG